MPFNLSDNGEALDGVLSVFGNDRAALADLLLAVGKVFVFFFGFVFTENAESYAAQTFTYISIARFYASCKGKAQTCPPMSCKYYSMHVLQGLTVFPAISCNLFTIYD